MPDLQTRHSTLQPVFALVSISCFSADYYFEYTECDSTGSRWRVAIPRTPGACTGLPEPVRGTECTFSCRAGEFLEMSSQECTQCPAGTYSLGSGIRFDQWDSLPPGFSSLATSLENGQDRDIKATCNSSSWLPQGNYLESNSDECTVSLIYAVHLKKKGSVSFDYQYPDIYLWLNEIIYMQIWTFLTFNCMDQSADTKWLKLTKHGEWASHTLNLKSGTNVLYWRTGGILMGTKVVKPVLLKNIQIEGVAYTSECFRCKPGTFSRAPGSSSCDLCPQDTFSGHGASSCTPCNTSTQYAGEGSDKCKARPPCSKKDYFKIHTACDNDGKTQIIYKWIEPKICLEGVPGAQTLPSSGDREPCPPCNPGFYNNDTATCSPCPPGTYSDGMKPCQSCPAGTEPTLGYEYKWWNVLPSNMKTSCLNVGNSKCDKMHGWEVAGDHIYSGAGGSDNDYLILNLHIPGFKLPTSASSDSATEYGRITFEFETLCTADCVMYFMMDVNRKSTTIVESWGKTQTRQTYTHIMTKNASVAYTWAFQRTGQPYDVSISRLQSCKWELVCVKKCPYLLFCVCFVHPDSLLGATGSLMNGPSFTSKGTKYFHLFNISLCGGQLATCSDNVTDLSVSDSQGEKGDGPSAVKTFICQSTIIPATGRGFNSALSSQSINLADTFLGATVEDHFEGISAKPNQYPQISKKVPDVNFYYRSLEPTSSCESGRSTVVTLRCNPVMSIKGQLSVPSQCPAGTCDGCTFYFLWESSGACPICTERDYHQIEGVCRGGNQEILFVWAEPKLCMGGVTLPEKKTLPCKSMELWVRLSAVMGTFTAVLLVSLTCYFWKKNKRLEYKYSRLIMSANKECEMPGADSCAVMEGENEGDMEDEVVYTKPSILGKLKAIASKRNGDHYENVQLNSSQSRTLSPNPFNHLRL
uniref:Endosome-lysosome associated apoptosis and autophagy regulator family member 2a n=1 Tax=Oryzias sinensis TaxID=183150 RepID=A0A8C7Y853_9TELE